MSKYTGLACLTFALLLSTSTRDTHAGEPPFVCRTFAVFLDFGVEIPDFSDGNSVLVQVEKSDTTPTTLQFIDPAYPELQGAWISGPAMYITKGEGRTPIGSFWWLVPEGETPEPPPIRAVTLTGPDALLIQDDVGNVTVQGGYIFPGNDFRMVVVTALFSK